MAKEKDSLTISANDMGKYLANLKTEYKGIEGTIALLEAVKNAKKIVERLESTQLKLETEVKKYEKLANTVLQDAENAEAESSKRVYEASKRADASIDGINKRGRELADKLSEKEKDTCDTINCLERSIVTKEKEAREREEAANKATAIAVNNKAKAEDALKAVYELAGGSR